MGCNCGKKFEVVLDGKVVYGPASKAAADAVAKRYPGSSVQVKATAATRKRTTPAPKTER